MRPTSRLRGALLIVGVVAVVLAATLAVVTHLQAAAKADGRKDAQVRAGMTTVREAIYAYSKDHKHFVPPPQELTSAELKDYLPAGESWPVNPFTGQPVRLGTGPGDFQYKPLGSIPTTCYTIDSVGTDGRSVW